MRTILETDKGIISGEDINGHCIRVTIEGRADLGSVILPKSITELEDGELMSAGETLMGREINTEFGTFILKGNKLYMRGRDTPYEVENPDTVQDNLYNIYSIMWKDEIEKEIRKAAKKEKEAAAEEKKPSNVLF